MTKGFARTIVLGCATLALLGAPPAARPQGKRKPAAPAAGRVGPARDEGALPGPVVEEMSRYTAPGPRHRELGALAGAWATRTRIRENPDAPPLEFAGSAEYRMILGGRFLQLESRTDVNGVEHHGLGIYGYNAFKERYSFYYLHDGDTQVLAGFGDRDSTGAAILFDVAMDMPGTGERAKPIRAVLRRASPDRHAFEMVEKHVDGREWKVLEITYERAR